MGSNQVSELVQSLVSLDEAEQPITEVEPCPSVNGEGEFCKQLTAAPGPEEVVSFREPLTITEIDVRLGDPIEGQKRLSFACNTLEDMQVYLNFDLMYLQKWYFQQAMTGALMSTIALAPSEKMSLQFNSTQRKELSQSTLEQVEDAKSDESQFVDRDVLNVTRSSSKTNNWNVSGNASITLPKFGLGISGSYSSSVTNSASSSAENVRESTKKSAHNLKMLHKVEVKEVEETTISRGLTRQINNPYADRSLLLKVYGLVKQYCVEFSLDAIRPTLALHPQFLFNRNFVLNNGDFLIKNLKDRYLQVELVQALENVIDLSHEDIEKQTQDHALSALHYLFDEINIFNVPKLPFSGGITDPSSLGGNSVALGFDASIDKNGLSDAIGNKLGLIFTTLNTYYKIYKDQVPIKPEIAIELAVSLFDYINPAWQTIEQTKDMNDVLDVNDRTEIFRRLGGFVAYSGGIIKPLMQPLEHEREAKKAAKHAEYVVNRVIQHLICYRKMYSEAFLSYLFELAKIKSIAHFVQKTVMEHLMISNADKNNLIKLLDFGKTFQDGCLLVVPMSLTIDGKNRKLFGKFMNEDQTDLILGLLSKDELILPADGVHLEPVPGHCHLADLPEVPAPGPLHVRIIESDPS